MSQSNKDTEDILDAIKLMMKNNQPNNEPGLPKDVIELTKPIDEKQAHEGETSILELTELVVEEQPKSPTPGDEEERKDIQIKDDQIRRVIRNTIETLPEETLNDIINEELKKIVLEKLSASKISISFQDNKE